jgi:phosphate transport system permease protein
VLAAVFLALGRALGETMAVTMLIGNREGISLSPFALGDSIASRIANQLTEADDATFRAALVALGLVLMLVTAMLNLAARALLARVGAETPPKDVATLEPDPLPAVAVPVFPGPLPAARVALRANRISSGILALAFAFTVLPLFLIAGYVAVKGGTTLTASLFTERARPPMVNEHYQDYKQNGVTPEDEFGRSVKRGGLGHAMVGTAVMVGLASLLAVPVGVLAAMALAQSPKSQFSRVVRFLSDWLAGVPSIVVGIFVVAVLVEPSYGRDQPLGFSGWAGAVALALLMVPIIVRSSEEAMRAVPASLVQASAALGASPGQTVWRVVLPVALPAITTGVLLAIGRVAGETAPLLLTAGNSDFWPHSPTDPTPFVTGSIYTYSRSQYQDWQDQAWGATFVLLAAVVTVNLILRRATRARS